jgi:hypothetical protein
MPTDPTFTDRELAPFTEPERQPAADPDPNYRTCGRCSYDTYGGADDLQHHLRTRHGVRIGKPTGRSDVTDALLAAEALNAARMKRLGARIARLDVNVRAERARLGAECGDMGAATIVDTGMRLARMEAVAEELGYALCVLAEGRTLRAALDAAVERLLAAGGPLGGMTTEVQRVRFAGMAEAVRILQDELA